MSKNRRRRIILLAFLVVGVGFYFFGSAYLWPPPDTNTIHAVGLIEAPEVNVTSRIAGRISEMNVLEGDSVRKGQVLCRIEDVDLRNQLQRAEADLQLAEVNAAQAERNYNRDRQLAGRGVISTKEFDDATNQLGQTRASVASAKANVQLYKDQLHDTTITAPIDGVVVNKTLEVGEWVQPGTPVVTVDDLSTIWARVDVQETDLAAVHVGEPAQVMTTNNPPTTFSGRVMSIGQEGQFATERDVQRGHQDIRTFYVKVQVLQNGGYLKPGMTAQVALSKRDGVASASNSSGQAD